MFNVQQLFIKRLINFQVNSLFHLFIGFLASKQFMSFPLLIKYNAVLVGYWSLIILFILCLFIQALKYYLILSLELFRCLGDSSA